MLADVAAPLSVYAPGMDHHPKNEAGPLIAQVEGDSVHDGHAFLRYQDVNFQISEARRIAASVLNSQGKWSYSVSWWQARNVIRIPLSPPLQSSFAAFRFEHFARHISSRRDLHTFMDPWPAFTCPWLDVGEPVFSTTAACTVQSAPLHFDGAQVQPAIDREGAIFLSFQRSIQRNILALHKKVVATSPAALSTDPSWLTSLRMLLNEAVSLIDITLHQLYFEAARGTQNGWKFDRDRLGQREGQRLKDKLAWIGLITGRPLDDAKRETDGFDVIRRVRNHMAHFDPPCFAFTMEDVVAWLNLISMVGRLAWRIRNKLGAQLTTELVGIIALPPVEFVPRPTSQRKPVDSAMGYASCIPRVRQQK